MRALLYMLGLYALLTLCFAPWPAKSEEVSPQIRALYEKLSSEFQANISCSIIALTLQDKIKVLEAELKELKEKK